MTGLIVLAARDALGLALLLAGGAKLADITAFRATLVALGLGRMRPERASRILAVILPTWEIGLGAATLAGLSAQHADIAVWATFTTFFLVVAFAARRRPGLSCRCFGAFGASVFDRKAVRRSGGLMGVATLTLFGGYVTSTSYSGSVPAIVLVVAGSLMFALVAKEGTVALTSFREVNR
jgi:hypothetical protein